MSTNPITATLRAFVVENFLYGDTSVAFEDSASLIGNGLMDSTGVLELVSFLEEHYGLSISDAEIVPANLDSVAAIGDFVARKATPAVAE